jgi:hypothetical protein
MRWHFGVANYKVPSLLTHCANTWRSSLVDIRRLPDPGIYTPSAQSSPASCTPLDLRSKSSILADDLRVL